MKFVGKECHADELGEAEVPQASPGHFGSMEFHPMGDYASRPFENASLAALL